MRRFLILSNLKIFWYQVCNFLLIWLWFKVENICDISILVYNLPHCLLERSHSLAVKNPNTLFTTFTWGKANHHSHLVYVARSQSMSHISLVEKTKGHILFPVYHKEAILIYASLPSLWQIFQNFQVVLLYPLDQDRHTCNRTLIWKAL